MEAHEVRAHILKLLGDGEMHSSDIYASIPGKERQLKRQLATLKKNNEVVARDRSYYSLAPATSTSAQTQSTAETRKKFSRKVRSAEDNEATISELLNEYDDLFKKWIADNGIEFEKRLENFKWLTMIGDKLMKRWSLVHVGYDTNTRQAQEDAKAKTEERQKEALKDAPLEEQVNVIGSFDLETKQLIDALPTLESLSKKEEEEMKV